MIRLGEIVDVGQHQREIGPMVELYVLHRSGYEGQPTYYHDMPDAVHAARDQMNFDDTIDYFVFTEYDSRGESVRIQSIPRAALELIEKLEE